MTARDDFSKETKDIAAKRVGLRCSNPNCRRSTSGPQAHPRKTLNIGVAAHITAAAPGGERYDKNMSREQRCSIENTIWLCQTCAKLIDNDAARYTADLLRQWRRLSEQAARLSIESTTADSTGNDADLIRFYAACFDRPAFQDPFHQEGNMEAFDRAIEDTITALNTGCLRARDGTILQTSKGKAYLNNHDWRAKLDAVVDLLRAIRSRYDLARSTGALVVDDGHGQWYCINDRSLAGWMDETRAQAIGIIAALCKDAGIFPPRGPHAPLW
ncbi:MAG TPA: hypothetical protein VKU01_05690 [Bryobacteraceae bacterium]|nr:hypothetical protein [Bryobacteraceae bacterium]